MRLAFITAILASAVLAGAPAALADGDPASDVLAGRSLFNPINSGVSPASQAQLQDVLSASREAGFPIRVALIASQNDLGTATKFWNDPKDYAYYLWTELSIEYGGQVLVVMPNGFGLYGPPKGRRAVSSAEAAVRAPAPGPGEQLASAALAAVPLLAEATGRRIPAAALAQATRSATAADRSAVAGGVSPGEVIALLMGALLIVLAWWASLRARPLQRGRQVET